MLGNAVLRVFSSDPKFEVYGTVRDARFISILQPKALSANLLSGINVDSLDNLTNLFEEIQPDIIVNCVGIVKQLDAANDSLTAIPINSILPHRLARLAQLTNARLIHPSTDCVYSGKKGNYTEEDTPDARDLYGLSKLLGEVDYPNAITLRTSIIGHEIESARSLVNWFLSQEGPVNGYRGAIFSGLPSVEIARVIHEFVVPRPDLHGLYHLSAEPINKFDLITLIGQIYGKRTKIKPTDEYMINRSLNSDRFKKATGYTTASWPDLISRMHAFW